MARRHAEEIRAAAEHEAHRLVKEAESQAALLRTEQLTAHQHEHEHISALRDDIENCLQTVSSALERARDLTVARMEAAPIALAPDADATDGPVPGQARPSAIDETHDRRRHIYVVAVAVWSVLMLSILLMVSIQPAEPGNTGVAPVLESDPQPPEATPTSSAPVTVRTTARTWALTVTFIANRDCWISITTDERVASERLLKANERVVIDANDVVTFKAGNAAALSILINEQPATPLGVEGQVVTRRITRENYRTFLATSDSQQ